MKNLAIRLKPSRMDGRSPRKFSTVQLKRRPTSSNLPSRRRLPKLSTSTRTSLQMEIKYSPSLKTSLAINFAIFLSVEFESIAFEETEPENSVLSNSSTLSIFTHSVTGLEISKWQKYNHRYLLNKRKYQLPSPIFIIFAGGSDILCISLAFYMN